MPTVRGKSELRQFFAQLPEDIERKLLRGAGQAAIRVIADEARDRSNSAEVEAGIKTKVRSDPGQVVAKVFVDGKWARSLAVWSEYGTSPHFISVDDSQRGGRSVNRINKNVLVINGQPVGTTVFHPGARPHPFLRPALDIKGVEAVAAAQRYINSRVTKSGIVGAAPGGDGE